MFNNCLSSSSSSIQNDEENDYEYDQGESISQIDDDENQKEDENQTESENQTEDENQTDDENQNEDEEIKIIKKEFFIEHENVLTNKKDFIDYENKDELVKKNSDVSKNDLDYDYKIESSNSLIFNLEDKNRVKLNKSESLNCINSDVHQNVNSKNDEVHISCTLNAFQNDNKDQPVNENVAKKVKNK